MANLRIRVTNVCNSGHRNFTRECRGRALEGGTMWIRDRQSTAMAELCRPARRAGVWGMLMDAQQLTGLRQVDLESMTRIYRAASTDVLYARMNDTDDERWPRAARSLCVFLDFVQTNDVLWGGLVEATYAVEGVEVDLDITWERLDEFTEAEFALLMRAGLDQDTAGRIVYEIRERLRHRDRATQADVENLRSDIETVQNYICKGDFATFGEPERRARNMVNSNAILTGGGALVATVADALMPLFPPFVAGSVVGGIAGAVGGFRAFTRRRRG